MKKVYSLITELHEVSGVQKVFWDIHTGIRQDFNAQIVSYLPYEEIVKYFDVPENEYIQIKSVCQLKNSVVFTHERKICSKCCLLNRLLHLNIDIIHIQHSIYNNLRLFSLYPPIVVSISDKVTENLISYFKLPPEQIVKIHNGIIDKYPVEWNNKYNSQYIRIAYVARVDANKRQLEVVEKLAGKLSSKVYIDFIGDGPLYEELKQKVKGMDNFNAIGYVNDVIGLMKDYDYIMLFSEKEGLPITLIEGAMCSKPLIVNDAGGNLEIAFPNKNAFYASNWDSLLDVLNSLENVSIDVYENMAKFSRQVYEQYYMYDKMIFQYKSLIKHIAKLLLMR